MSKLADPTGSSQPTSRSALPNRMAGQGMERVDVPGDTGDNWL